LQAKDGFLTLTGTDSEIELIQKIRIIDLDSACFDLAVPAKKFYDICRTLPSGAELHLSQRGEQLIVRSERSRFVLSLISTLDFPSAERIAAPSYSFPIQASLLNNLFKKTAFSIALQDVRFFFNGLLLSLQGNICTATATDGHRLSSSARPIDFRVAQAFQVLIPRKAILELTKLLEVDQEMLIEFQVADNHMSIVSDEFIFTSKLIEGAFPDYRQIIPRNAENLAIIAKDELKSALLRVATLCNEKYRGAWLYFDQDRLRLHTNNPDRDEAEEELSINYRGKDVRIGCNINYLMDVLNVIDADFVHIHLVDNDRTILIDSEACPDDQYVIMPLCL
jgi:DNA polymerase-3 subunit beta